MSGEQETTRPRTPKGTFLPVPETKERAALLLARYENGELIEKIAKDLKITHQAAYKSLLKYCQDDWKDSQVARALAEYERAKNKVSEIGRRKRTEKYDAQNDQVALACAREELRSAQWELERLCNRLFGNKQEVGSAAPIQINIGIARHDAVQPLQRSTEHNVIDVSVETK